MNTVYKKHQKKQEIMSRESKVFAFSKIFFSIGISPEAAKWQFGYPGLGLNYLVKASLFTIMSYIFLNIRFSVKNKKKKNI